MPNRPLCIILSPILSAYTGWNPWTAGPEDFKPFNSFLIIFTITTSNEVINLMMWDSYNKGIILVKGLSTTVEEQDKVL